jgi:hypothetical protein
MTAPLPVLPLHDLGDEISAALALMTLERARLDALVDIARRHYTPPFVAIADRLSKRWLARNSSPYRGEIAAIARMLGRPGGYFLNVSFEWSCTSGVARDPAGTGMRLLRVLDWPLAGLGRNLVAARQRGPAGAFTSLTWPGFAGTVTALAPGRFAAALNQAPIPRHVLGIAGSFAVQRAAVWRRREIPPMHLLRQVMEGCASYADAKLALTHTPLAVGGLFTLAGPRDGEGCVIERTAFGAAVIEAPACVANDWLSPGRRGLARGHHNEARRASMERVIAAPSTAFDWLAPPVLNRTTRVVCEMNPAAGTMAAQGWEEDGPATAVLRISG